MQKPNYVRIIIGVVLLVLSLPNLSIAFGLKSLGGEAVGFLIGTVLIVVGGLYLVYSGLYPNKKPF